MPTISSSSPLVSVVVATRNRPGPLSECLGAIAEQTHDAIEVIVSDDGSNQETRDAYRTICPALEHRLKWIMFEHPDTPGTGPAAARNRGLRAATGEYVAFCDDDDVWIRNDHLAVGTAALESSRADFFFCDVIATRQGIVSDHVWYEQKSRLTSGDTVDGMPDSYRVHVDIAVEVVSGSVIHLDCWVVRKALLDAVGFFWERLWFGEDYDMMMRTLDRATGVVFRATPSAENRLPEPGGVSSMSGKIDSILQDILAAAHVRTCCSRSEVLKRARARQAWGLRRLAREHRAHGDASEGRRLAWEGFATYPTLGGLAELLLGRTRG